MPTRDPLLTKAYVYIGKFQPFHNGHKKALDIMVEAAEDKGLDAYLFTTEAGGHSKTHPLDIKYKTKLIKSILNQPKYENVKFHTCKSGPHDAVPIMRHNFKQEPIIVAGTDRIDYRTKYSVEVLEIPRDDSMISGSKLKKLAYKAKKEEEEEEEEVEDDDDIKRDPFTEFRRGVDEVYPPHIIKELFDKIKNFKPPKRKTKKKEQKGGSRKKRGTRRRRRRTTKFQKRKRSKKRKTKRS